MPILECTMCRFDSKREPPNGGFGLSFLHKVALWLVLLAVGAGGHLVPIAPAAADGLVSTDDVATDEASGELAVSPRTKPSSSSAQPQELGADDDGVTAPAHNAKAQPADVVRDAAGAATATTDTVDAKAEDAEGTTASNREADSGSASLRENTHEATRSLAAPAHERGSTGETSPAAAQAASPGARPAGVKDQAVERLESEKQTTASIGESADQPAASTVETVTGSVVSVAEPVEGLLAPVAEPVDEVVNPADETRAPTGETVTKGVGSVATSAEDVLFPVGEPVDDVLEPIGETLASAGEPLARTVGTVAKPVEEVRIPVVEPVDEVVKPVEDALAPLIDPVDALAPLVDPVKETLAPIAVPAGEVLIPVVEPVDEVAVHEILPPITDPTNVYDPFIEPNKEAPFPVGWAGEPVSPDVPLVPSPHETASRMADALPETSLLPLPRVHAIAPTSDVRSPGETFSPTTDSRRGVNEFVQAPVSEMLEPTNQARTRTWDVPTRGDGNGVAVPTLGGGAWLTSGQAFPALIACLAAGILAALALDYAVAIRRGARWPLSMSYAPNTPPG